AQPVETLDARLTVAEALAVLERGRHRVYPVVDASGRPIGRVTRADVLVWRVEGGLETQTLAERVSDAALPVVHPDDVAARAVELMLAADEGRIPVTDPASGQLVGLV